MMERRMDVSLFMADPSCENYKKGSAIDQRFANPLANEVSRAFIPPCTCVISLAQAAALGPALRKRKAGTLATNSVRKKHETCQFRSVESEWFFAMSQHDH
jgi:hypothetical protein